jgi:hypothetical protein
MRARASFHGAFIFRFFQVLVCRVLVCQLLVCQVLAFLGHGF